MGPAPASNFTAASCSRLLQNARHFTSVTQPTQHAIPEDQIATSNQQLNAQQRPQQPRMATLLGRHILRTVPLLQQHTPTCSI